MYPMDRFSFLFFILYQVVLYIFFNNFFSVASVTRSRQQSVDNDSTATPKKTRRTKKTQDVIENGKLIFLFQFSADMFFSHFWHAVC